MATRCALQVRELSKRFGETQALSSVDLDLVAGETHGLLGHNGSGKSTLIKILSGYQNADSGSVVLNGVKMALPAQPAFLRDAGVRFVHQSLGLVDRISVAENLWLEQIALGTRHSLGFKSMVRDANDVLSSFGQELDPRALVGELTAVQKANLAIVRATLPPASGTQNLRVLVLDEPTAFLPPEDKRDLYGLVRSLTERGTAVLFVSHFLDEVLGLCDTVSVLRDGRAVVRSRATADLTRADLVRSIVGNAPDSPVLSRHGVTRRDRVQITELRTETVREMSIGIGEGEIVGLTGPVGSGSESVPHALFGTGSAVSGTLCMDGEAIDLADLTPTRAIGHGIGLVPAERNGAGLYVGLPVCDNLTSSNLELFSKAGTLDRNEMLRSARETTRTYSVRPPDPRLPTSALSGGNAQKVLVAKWLQKEPKLLLLAEPTQGVDVGARQSIESILLGVAARGTSVLVTSGDPEQLATLCHRVMVLNEGRVVRTLAGESVNRRTIAEACLGSPGRIENRDGRALALS